MHEVLTASGEENKKHGGREIRGEERFLKKTDSPFGFWRRNGKAHRKADSRCIEGLLSENRPIASSFHQKGDCDLLLLTSKTPPFSGEEEVYDGRLKF